MIFSSVTFLIYFLPIFLIVYYVAPGKKVKNLILLAASLVFYAWGEPVYIVLMIFSSVSDYAHGLFIEKNRGNKWSKAALISSIVINLALLMFFKYADFVIMNLNQLGGFDIQALNLPLPIGISFYTFQTMSYTIDVYRGRVKAQKDLLALATYVTMFPQLIAGPIVRYKDICKELEVRSITIDKVIDGFYRFSIGLVKKVLIANTMSRIVANVMAVSMPEISMTTAWLGALAFAFQIYFDFSGYSDMAIGLGRMLGFNFLENFNHPYMSLSVTEFWQRWHISLGSWFRDYLYIPLGGNRVNKIKWIRNILIVWFCTGLWHGASWNFVLWGLYFGVLLFIEKRYLHILTKLPKVIRWAYTMFLILMSWVIFYFENIRTMIQYLLRMFSFKGITNIYAGISKYELILVFLVSILASTPAIKMIYQKLEIVKLNFAFDIILAGLVFFSIILLADGSPNPFIYFRF